MNMSEAELQMAVADYLRMRYSDVIFRSDYGSGLKLTMGQAVRQKRMNGGQRAFPDMAIFEPVPRYADGDCDHEWHGLLIELKKEGTRLKKKNGEWASQHIAEQADDDYMKFKEVDNVYF